MFLTGQKIGQIWRSRSKILVPRKGLITRNTHVKYESSMLCHSKVMAQVKVFLSGQKVGQIWRSRSQGQKFWYQWKGLITRNTHDGEI